MPHDRNGNKIEAGDIVAFLARVNEVHENATACNASFQFLQDDGLNEYAPIVTCNTRLCEKQSESCPERNARIAIMCHEVNRALCVAFGDDSQKPWREAEQWQRDSAIKGVEFALKNPDASPAAQHDAWCADKVADGWHWGPTKNPAVKQHPCLVQYESLPPEQRAKDHTFRAIVKAMTD